MKRGPASFVAAAGLFVVAAITAWDASQIRRLNTYGLGPESAPYLVAGLFALLGAGHVWHGLRHDSPATEPADWKAMGWVGLALGALMLVIELGGGFIIAATLLFALTARAFGRKALLADVVIGAVLATCVFLLFSGVLTLSLPAGPIERLL